MAQSNINELMLRKDKHKALRNSQCVPENTLEAVIIPCLERTYGFKTNSYVMNKEILEDFIDQKTFQNFITSANKIIDAQLLMKAKSESLPFFCWTFFFLKISIAVGFLSFTVLSTLVYFDIDPSLQNIFLYTCVGCIMFSVVIASLSPIHLYSKKFPDYNFHQNIKQQLRKLVDDENSKNRQENRGHLRWKMDKQFFWIKLEINRLLYQQKNPTNIHYRFAEQSDTHPIS